MADDRHDLDRAVKPRTIPTSGLPALVSNYPDVTRLVLVEQGSKRYQHDMRMGDPEATIALSFQDEGRTLKIFVEWEESGG